ncbi:TetR/AcrR family transcriptional regulator C-terminal domain-containing protein [Nocardia sp. BMG111209]|uniref:TetR/AcrR family transcriptional regulator C-terminal domain-containing protein n=1 Tax=Nocardia sp. BMG111209 TaxID=1160137 RepID=UPI0005606995|nr:TetR/AcrR family transcriptional regulator C-terminal domain-containing protein [Nocardia sp. BMG111209]
MTRPFTSVWTREPRQPKSAGLRREQIVAAAVELLDAEGLDQLSMRKLGSRLGAGATSLYWHVANKDELLELTLDEIWALVEVPESDLDSWREIATTFAYSMRGAVLAHPWAATVAGQFPSVGPHAFALMERLRRTFVRAGFTGTDIYLAAGTVMSYVLGQVIPEISARRMRGGGGEWTLDATVDSADLLAADYPELLADYRATRYTDMDAGYAVAFDFGLLCVLDGLAARLTAPGAR